MIACVGDGLSANIVRGLLLSRNEKFEGRMRPARFAASFSSADLQNGP
jgi:hypothetical protein